MTKPAFGLAVKLAAAPAEARAVTSADSLARDARRYAAVDRTIRPERFCRSRSHDPCRARRRGPSGRRPGSRASIDAADRVYTARQDAAHR